MMSDVHIHRKSDNVSPIVDDKSDDDKFISTQTTTVSSTIEEENVTLTLESSTKPLNFEEKINDDKHETEDDNIGEFQNIELSKKSVDETILHSNKNLPTHAYLESDESSNIDLFKGVDEIDIADEEIDLNTNSSEYDKKDESDTLDELPPLPPPVLQNTTYNDGETPDELLERLETTFENGNVESKIIIKGVLDVLVGGSFDLDSKFRIEYPKAIDSMLKILDKSSIADQVETWTIFSHFVKKSFINLEACSEVGLISKLLDRLPRCESIVADLIIQLLSLLSSYSITVKETKRFLRALHATNGVWPRYSVKLLSVMKEMPKKDTADVFFSFPGKKLSGLALPPLIKWPYQNGWSFSTWLRMDPSNGSQFERETPYLFYFCTEKGLGYCGYFMGSCLVIRSIKSNNNIGGQKECIKCIKQPLIPRKWHHIALSYNYSRWGKNDINVYIDGVLIETLEVNWLVSTTDHFNRCFIGCGPNENNSNESFCGQICAIYVFSQSISPQQANCLFCLGPGYQSYFKHDAESNLPDGYKKHLFDGSLNNSMVLAYCPKNCHEQLCLMPSNKVTASKASSGSQAMNSFFVQVPHAILKNVKVVTTHSIHSSLHSVGGIQMLLPLFTQVDMLHTDHSTIINYDICANLLSVISLLLKTSVSAQQQLFHSKGFLIVAHTLSNVSPNHLTLDVLKTLIEMARFLMKCYTTGLPLLKHLVDHILLNPQLWYRSKYHVQKELYKYLIEEGLCKNGLGTVIRRTPAILELVHSLKTNYWIARPTDYVDDNGNVKICETKRITEEIKIIRKLILDLIDKLMFNKEQILNKDNKRDEEFQIIFNFLATESRDENLFDILCQIMKQLAIHAAIMVPAFDNNKGISVIYELMSSPNENIRIPVLKILGNYLCRSTIKRKNDSIHNQNLLALISDKLLQNCTYLSKACYNVLYEILIEDISPELNGQNDLTKNNTDNVNFENPQLLKVIATLITQSELCDESMEVRKSFLEDLLKLCTSNKDNRRTILQLSVWQEWLISLAFIYPKSDIEANISEIVYKIFKVLLEHAIKIEFGGWRVWVDTLAISHAKVSWENYQREIKQENLNENVACYRTPDFIWSHVQLRLLNDLLDSIETTISKYNTSGPVFTDFITGIDNQTFISNTIHIISQLSDSLVISCGGLLPLLAAATSPNSELDIVDTSKQGLAIYDATRLLHRFALLSDSFIFMSAAQLTELEQEKNMPNGGILRQMLRLSATIAVRNILACRVSKNERPSLILPGDNATQKQLQRADAIIQFIDECFPNYKNVLDIINGLPSSNFIPDVESLLQNSDLSRLRGIVYRDMDEPRQAQFLALAIIYFLSVLMVSRYRDILEPPTTPSPFFDTNNSGQTLKTSSLNETESTSIPKNSINHDYEISNKIDTVSSHNLEKEMYKENEEEEENEEEDKSFQEISSIKIIDNTTIVNKPTIEETNQLNHFNNSDAIKFLSMTKSEKQAYLTERLQKALESTAPVLREIMMDFKNYLQKSLLGTHGQEIMNDDKVMQTLKNLQGSVIELVMLLCSQEWQTSLQKHAGLAFIELVNEGRLMAHATREHILRVANEADFILNRLRAEDVSKHTTFQNDSNDRLRERKEQERLCEHLIESARRRDLMVAEKMLENMKTMIMSPNGAWSDNDQEPMIFWKLDTWEDDSRRRKRFIPNPHGGRLSMARLHQAINNISEEVLSESRQKLLKELKKRNAIVSSFGNNSNSQEHQVEDTDICKWLEESMDMEIAKKDSNSIYSTSCKLIAPGLVVPGTISITMTDLYFDADEGDDLYGKQNPKVLRYCDFLHGRWRFPEIRAIFLRRYMLQYTALELFIASRTAIMFSFENYETVKLVVEHLPSVGVGVKYGLPQKRKTSLMKPKQLFKFSDMPSKWQRREVSNFDYLMFLNTISGRTYNDLNQYPVFPWILSNYTSNVLDLKEPSNFRDLTKPIGALSETRKKFYKDRFDSWVDETIPPFHYGTHYSTEAFVLNWMFRQEPFTSIFLDLQSGKFDHSDRLFHSISQAWENCQKNPQDVKELIPELFYLPEILKNSNKYDLGIRENGQVVDDVQLPPWADGSPEKFIQIHRQALESDLVSCQLNQWIDLIFGYKQRGPEAIRATNVFYYLSYEGSVNKSAIEDPITREGIEKQILSFGQTPVQLLIEPHPVRQSLLSISPFSFQPVTDDLCMLMKFISNSPVVHLSANTHMLLANPTVISIAQNLVFSLNKWNNNYINYQQTSTNSQLLISNEDKDRLSTNNGPSTTELPLTVDPLLAIGNPSTILPKRHLGDSFDQRFSITSSNFVTSLDSKIIIACGYPDYSFRVIDSENATVKQVVYGHGDVVTCLGRSEQIPNMDFYVVSGSIDCTVVLWHFNTTTNFIAGEYNIHGEPAAPRAILTGHDSRITALTVSAENGIVVSGSIDGTVLMHTVSGDLIRRIQSKDLLHILDPLKYNDYPGVTHIMMNRDCIISVIYNHEIVSTFTSTGYQLNIPLHKSTEKIFSAVLSRDGEYLIIGTENGRISVLRLFPLQVVYTFQQTDSPIRSLSLPTNQRFILAGLDSGAIVVFNVDFNRWHYEYKQRNSQ